MTQAFTATCLAATLAVGLAAQSTGTGGTAGTATSQAPQTTGQRGGGPRMVTGCLRTGDTPGSYMLTDAVIQGGGERRGGDATSTGASTTAVSTAGTATTSGTGTDPQSGRAMAPTSIVLNAASDVDLKPHVGHKIEVTGTMAGGRSRDGDPGGSATSTATGGTASGAGTTATGSATATSGQGTGRGGLRSMTVTTVRMISESCS